uniref:TGS domain-containing protein n=1 Tax=Macrostomum lignano TaxID=282301 RepID=A0A1I8F809_9PLAT
ASDDATAAATAKPTGSAGRPPTNPKPPPPTRLTPPATSRAAPREPPIIPARMRQAIDSRADPAGKPDWPALVAFSSGRTRNDFCQRRKGDAGPQASVRVCPTASARPVSTPFGQLGVPEPLDPRETRGRKDHLGVAGPKVLPVPKASRSDPQLGQPAQFGDSELRQGMANLPPGQRGEKGEPGSCDCGGGGNDGDRWPAEFSKAGRTRRALLRRAVRHGSAAAELTCLDESRLCAASWTRTNRSRDVSYALQEGAIVVTADEKELFLKIDHQLNELRLVWALHVHSFCPETCTTRASSSILGGDYACQDAARRSRMTRSTSRPEDCLNSSKRLLNNGTCELTALQFKDFGGKDIGAERDPSLAAVCAGRRRLSEAVHARLRAASATGTKLKDRRAPTAERQSVQSRADHLRLPAVVLLHRGIR